MSVTQVRQNVRPTMAVAPQRSTERHHEAFSQVAALPQTFSIHPNDTVNFYRARTDNKNVVLRVLKGKLSCLNQVLVLQSIPAKWLTNKCFPFFVSKMLFKVKHDQLLTVTGNVKSNSVIKYLFFPETATSSEKQKFLGFASFVSGLGPHPFIPVLLGVMSAQSPLVMVVEELQQRDLLGFLWRCRQVVQPISYSWRWACSGSKVYSAVTRIATVHAK